MEIHMNRYAGKRVVIIGGTSGIGLATAKMLIDGGARVLVTGRSQAGLESAQKELGKGGVVISSDAGSLTDIDALASRVKTEFDTLDLLFVNAGFSLFAPIENTTEAMYDEVFGMNAKGPFFAVKKLAPLINQGGAVVFTTAISNVKGMPMLHNSRGQGRSSHAYWSVSGERERSHRRGWGVSSRSHFSGARHSADRQETGEP
jgi:NAD(P)-dependent dehydrogenase (short-subunit alcohol dehydrogenase family)